MSGDIEDGYFCVICGFSMDTECFACDLPLCRSCARHNGGTCDEHRIPSPGEPGAAHDPVLALDPLLTADRAQDDYDDYAEH
jgi:hypothetical protein